MFCSYFSTFHSSPWCLTSLSEASCLEGRWSWQEETTCLFLPLASLPPLLNGYYQLLPDIVLLLLFSCCSVVSDSLWPHWLQHARLPCPWPSPEVCSNSCPLSWRCHPTISSLVTRFSSCPQSFPASGSFLTGWLFTSGSQSIGTSASASVLPRNIPGWFPLGLTGLISGKWQSMSGSQLSFHVKSFITSPWALQSDNQSDVSASLIPNGV